MELRELIAEARTATGLIEGHHYATTIERAKVRMQHAAERGDRHAVKHWARVYTKARAKAKHHEKHHKG